ncbi:MAG TPA: DUF488 domain-containing protein [Nautiliaceae bacterium]|nr:DUF488 domain-containing protein [Nautiliaceae bacterium]
MREIYTTGHSILEVDKFISLLKDNNIDTIVDVRSIPYSKFASQFNKETLKHYLKENNIYYIYMGDSLGARYEDKALLFDDGKVNFKKVQETISFQNGISRLEKGLSKGYKIALMCSEKEAFDCHRFVLISEFLARNGISIKHIYPDKVVSQEFLEQKLLKKYEKKLPVANLFDQEITDELRLKLAYEFRNKDIAYNAFTKEGDEE